MKLIYWIKFSIKKINIFILLLFDNDKNWLKWFGYYGWNYKKGG
jgi:hypothetical protein